MFLVLDLTEAEQPLFDKSLLSFTQDLIAEIAGSAKEGELDFVMSNLAILLILQPAI